MANLEVSFVELIKVLADPSDQIEDALLTLAIAFLVPHATGDQLDIVGTRVGQLRNGMDDAAYRTAIKARVLVNRSTGCFRDVKAIALHFVDWLAIDSGGGVAVVDIARQSEETAQTVYDFLLPALEVTVRLQVYYLPQDAEISFTFSTAAITLGTISGGTVEVQGADALPTEGSVIVGAGTALEETAVFTNRSTTHLFGLTTANAHLAGTAIQLTNDSAMGFSSAVDDLGLGGYLADIIGS
jgi:hypothetical protein